MGQRSITVIAVIAALALVFLLPRAFDPADG